MQIQKTPHKSLLKRPLFWVITVIVLAIAATSYYFLVARQKSDTINPPNTVNYEPPTDQEKRETEEFKQNQEKQADQPDPTPATPAPDGRKAVTPTISYIGQYDAAIEASALVPSVIEDGTCTLTLKKGSSTVTKTNQAVKDARSTRCALFTFPAKELAKGTWTATVNFSSATSTGTSAASTLEVK